MAEVEIKVKIDGVEYSQQELKDLASGAKTAAKEMDDLNKETKEAGDQQGFFSKKLDEAKETLSGFKAGFADIKKGYATMKAGITGVAKGFGLSSKAAKVFGTTASAAIAATGIGLLVPLVLALVDYFKNLEGGAKTLKKIMAGLGAIVANVGKALKLLVQGKFGEAFNTMKDAVNGATQAVDSLFDAEKKLADLRKRTVIENAKLNQQIEAQKKVLEDTTLSLDERIAALDEVTAATKKLAENQIAETQLALQAAEAQLTLTNNYEERREKQLEIAELQAQLIEQQTTLQGIEYDAERVGREIRTQAAEERKAQIEERLAQEKTVAETLRDLRIEDIKDEQSKAEATLQVQREAALATLRENNATKEQLLEAEKLYDGQLETLRQEFADKESERAQAAAEKKEQERQAELEKEKAQQQRLKEILDTAYFESIENEFQRAQEELSFQEQKAMEELALLGATEAEKQRIRDGYQKKREKLAQDEANYNMALKKAERDNELNLAAGAFGAIAGLVGEQTAVGKAAAIATTTIQTYQAAQAAYASQMAIPDPSAPVRAAIAAGIAIATGIANVQKIISTPTPGKGGGGGGGGGATPGRPNTPTFSGNTGSLDLGFNQGASIGQSDTLGDMQTGAAGVESPEPLKAYVVATEMTDAQDKNKAIEDIAKL